MDSLGSHDPDRAEDPEFGGFVAPAAPRGRNRRQVALLAGALAVAVAAAGGAYALGVGSELTGGGTQPDDVLRSGAIALAKVDLNPSLGQKLAVWQLSQKFPAAFNAASKDAVLKDSVVAALLRDTPLSYASDVRPWLGDRAAIAAYPAAGKGAEPELAFALQYTDEAAMTAALQKLDRSRPITWVTRSHYVVIAERAAQAADLLAADDAHAMSGQRTYRSDIAALGGGQLALGWADLAGAGAAAVATIAHLAAGTAVDLVQSALAGQTLPTGGGRVAVGLHADADYLELVGRGSGGGPGAGPAHRPGTDLAGAMPADSVAAISLTDLVAADGRINHLLAAEPAFGSAVKGLDKRYGLNVAGLLEAIFGQETAVALGPAHGKTPDVTLRTTGGDAGRAGSILGLITTMVGDKFAKLRPTADGFVIGTDPTELKAAAGAGHPLADTADFRAAVPDAAGAGLVAYANIAGLVKEGVISPTDAKGLEHVQAVGLTSSGGDNPAFRMRVTVN
jgi:hypothetical protein